MKEKRKVNLSFRVTELENELLKELMRLSNQDSLSDFIRGNMLSNLDQVTSVI